MQGKLFDTKEFFPENLTTSKTSSTPLLEPPENCVIVDIETTGLNPLYDSIIEISALKIKNGEIAGEFSSLINPCRKIPYFITKLTGITNEMVKKGGKKEDVLKDFCAFLGFDPIVGHNIKFDLSFINKNLKNIFGGTLVNNYADTLFFAKQVYSHLSSKKLTEIAKYLNIDTKNAHRALNDCYITFYVLKDIQNNLSKYTS